MPELMQKSCEYMIRDTYIQNGYCLHNHGCYVEAVIEIQYFDIDAP